MRAIPVTTLGGLHAAACFAMLSSAFAAVPSEYTLTNITGWSAAQLANLPYFDRYVPVEPAGAGPDYTSIAQSGFGVAAGNRDYTNGGWVQGSGAFVEDGAMTSISAWLLPGYWWSYSWSWTYWDGTDYHFQNGFVTHSPARDVNALGQVVGYATVPGSGSGSGSSSAYDDHAWIYDTATGEKVDITPGAHRADPKSINDYGQVVGTWSDAAGHHPFLRDADGAFLDFTLAAPTTYALTPTVINSHRTVAGNAIVYTVPLRDQRAWVCETGAAVTRLPFPSQNSPDVATIADINEHGILVGEAHKAAAAYETLATRWTKSGASWVAEDLTELLADNMDFILDRCIAVNDAGHIIASGHLDGGPDNTYNTHRLLLTPDVFAPPAVTTLPPSNVASTSATLRAKVNASNLATTWHVDYGPTAAYGASTISAALSGTAPALGEAVLTGLSPHTTYHYRATGGNSEGDTDGADVAFTTPWNWTSWATAHLGAGSADPAGDANGNHLPDLLDYGTGNAAPPAVAMEAGQMKITFRHALLAEGVTLVVQVSDDLEHWEDGSSYGYTVSTPSNAVSTEFLRIPDGADGELITVCVDAAATRRYLRLAALSP